jgi:hypothetical protein
MSAEAPKAAVEDLIAKVVSGKALRSSTAPGGALAASGMPALTALMTSCSKLQSSACLRADNTRVYTLDEKFSLMGWLDD